MTDIVVFLKDGKKLEFKHQGRSGGSYTKTLKLKDGFAIIVDEWYNETIIPSENIEKIETSSDRSW